MSRLEGAYARARGEKRAALVTYLCAGDPDLETTRRLVHEVARAGADVIELGVPFSDPIADGPTIQAASFRALQKGTTLEGVLRTVAQLRAEQCEAPIVLMSYLNPIHAFGLERFATEARRAGVDGLIVPDLPLEAADPLAQVLAPAGVDLVLLAAPTTPAERLARIGARTRGFLYFVSVAGVTGGRTELPAELPDQLARARANTAAPVSVGFGIARPEQVRQLARQADGVIVGSALVKLVHESNADTAQVGAFVASLRAATGQQ